MREKEREPSAGGVMCMSPSQVKQALNKLEKDGERRNAMNALKHCVETMDAASVPRFLTQVSETREKGSSRAYAISLYEDVARVHGNLIVPHIPRVMCTLTRTLSSSGSSPQLQQACSKVVSAVAKHAIEDSSPAHAAQVLRELCGPLLEVLAGKLEPLATGAALCLQTLVESERWKFAPDELVEDVCLKTAVALSEKGTRTVAHMQLARALAGANASLLSRYGVALLRAGADTLRVAPSASWQLRASAARLLTAVLPTVDRATLAEELSGTVQALDGCKHDRMSNVRWSVKEALKTAKVLLVEENSRRSGDGEDLLVLLFTSSPSASPRRRSLGGSSDDMVFSELASKTSRGGRSPSPASVISLSPSAPSDSPRFPGDLSQPRGGRHHRSPLRATRLHIRVASFDNATANSVSSFDSPRKENLPSRNPDMKAGGVANSDPSPSSTPRSAGKYARPRPQAPGGTFIPYPPSLGEETDGGYRRSHHTETGTEVILKSRERNSFTSPEKLATTVSRGRDLLPGFEDVFLLSSGASTDCETKHETADQNMGFGEQEQFPMKASSRDTTPNSGTSRGLGVLDASTMKHVFELKGPVVGNLMRNAAEQSAVGTRNADENGGAFVSPVKRDLKESSKGLSITPSRDGSPAQLESSDKSPFNGQQGDALIAADDFLPFSTPRRLVRSLQACYLSPADSTASSRFADHDVTKRGEDVADNLTTIDMDLGTPNSSSTGWSVRTNPIASEDTQKSESDESDSERGRSTWKKMAPHTPPVQEAENPEADESFCRRLIHPAAGLAQEADGSVDMFEMNLGGDLPSTTFRGSVELKDQLLDEVEIIKRTQQERVASGAGNSLRSMPSGSSEADSAGKCCCNHSPPPSGNAAGPAPAEVGDESCCEDTCTSVSTSDPCSGKGVSSRLNFREIVGKRWGSGRDSLLTWHLCVVVIAIPLALALAKVFFPTDSHRSGYLVPT